MRRYLIVIALVGLMVLTLGSCTDRGTNVPPIPPTEQWAASPLIHSFFPDLIFQLRNPKGLANMVVYVPAEAFPRAGQPNVKVPLLILLPPQDGDQYFYMNAGLFQLVEQMTDEGIIEPMAIACLSNDRVFGGYFYGNSHPAGFHDSILGTDLITFLEQDRFPTSLLATPGQRGIGGVGQGAYGAFRAALINPGTFTSITVTDGPLDFDGATGTGGLIPLMQNVLTEQGITSDEDYFALDSSSVYRLSRLFIGGSLAFSPHDTALLGYELQYIVINRGGGIQDTVDYRISVPDSLRVRMSSPADSATLISDINRPGPGFVNDLTGFDFHLPFTRTQIPYAPHWSLWMRNNLDSLHERAGGSPLNSVRMWFGTTDEAEYGYAGQTASFITFLQGQGYTPEVFSYSGTTERPASGNQYLYDLLRKMLIFHSNNFKANNS